jgi:hypothetical protein
MYEEAIKSYEEGLKFNGENAQIKQGLEQAKKDKAAADSDESGMFGP